MTRPATDRMKKKWIVLLVAFDLVFTALLAIEFIRIESRLYKLTGVAADVIARQSLEIQAHTDGIEWEGPPMRVTAEEAKKASKELHTNHEYVGQIAGFLVLLVEKFLVMAVLIWIATRVSKFRSKPTQT